MPKIHELRAHGVTILFVSHETSDVKVLCERCLWLRNGVVEALGDADAVVGQYLRATLQQEAATPALEAGFGRPPFHGHRYGDGRATILTARSRER